MIINVEIPCRASCIQEAAMAQSNLIEVARAMMMSTDDIIAVIAIKQSRANGAIFRRPAAPLVRKLKRVG
jgi:hypothetical protein